MAGARMPDSTEMPSNGDPMHESGGSITNFEMFVRLALQAIKSDLKAMVSSSDSYQKHCDAERSAMLSRLLPVENDMKDMKKDVAELKKSREKDNQDWKESLEKLDKSVEGVTETFLTVTDFGVVNTGIH